MKRSFFGPMLFVGIMMLLGGYFGMIENDKKMEAADIALENFIAQYQNGNDYNALFKNALAIYEKANSLQSDIYIFSTSPILGLMFIGCAFDRRRMFKTYQELKRQLEGQSFKLTAPERVPKNE